MELTQNEVAEIATRHGIYNDFGKTFFTDSELFEFVIEVFSINNKKASNVVKAEMRKASDERGVEW